MHTLTRVSFKRLKVKRLEGLKLTGTVLSVIGRLAIATEEENRKEEEVKNTPVTPHNYGGGIQRSRYWGCGAGTLQ